MIMQGATARVRFDLGEMMGPMDLTGAKIHFVYRYGMFGESQELECHVSNAQGGLAQVVLTPEQTADEGQMYYQIRIRFDDGTVVKSERCSIYIEQSL